MQLRPAQLASHLKQPLLPLYVVAGEEPLLNLANAFVEVGTAEGVFQKKLDYWIKGEGAQLELEPRWSIGRNVLGWWE